MSMVAAPRMTERDLQAAVIDLAHLYGWRVAHFRPALTKRGWRTAVQGDGMGFPDLLLVKGGRLLVAELKAGAGRLSAAQELWLGAFMAITPRVYIWKPEHWHDGSILKALTEGQP